MSASRLSGQLEMIMEVEAKGEVMEAVHVI